MGWLRRLFFPARPPSPALACAASGAHAPSPGIVRLASGEVRAFVHVRYPLHRDRAAFVSWLVRLRTTLEALPVGVQPVFPVYPSPELWLAVWSREGDATRVLAVAARAGAHMAPLLDQPPALVTDVGELARLSAPWGPAQALEWGIDYEREAWTFTWSPGRATLTQVRPPASLPPATVRELPPPAPARRGVPRLRS